MNLTNEIEDDIKKITKDFTNAFNILNELPYSVSIFGSARTKSDNLYYKAAFLLSKKLSDDGFAIITGGSSGIMEAANKGADISVGLRINLANEQKTNKFVNKKVDFNYFFSRKASFIKYAKALVYFPGGFGTLDELFEALCLIQTKTIQLMPIVLFGTEYFGYLNNFFNLLVKDEYIKEEDLELFLITDSIDEAYQHIKNSLALN